MNMVSGRAAITAFLPFLAALGGCPSSERLTLHLALRASEQSLLLQEQEPDPF